jgi:hypothetical protein
MALPSFVPNAVSQRRGSLAEIDAAVSARLGPTRGLGNSQPACFNRQVGMCLARYVGRWSTTVIGRFYNGHDHSAVCYGIQRVEALRHSDPPVDPLITDLKHELRAGDDPPRPGLNMGSNAFSGCFHRCRRSKQARASAKLNCAGSVCRNGSVLRATDDHLACKPQAGGK